MASLISSLSGRVEVIYPEISSRFLPDNKDTTTPISYPQDYKLIRESIKADAVISGVVINLENSVVVQSNVITVKSGVLFDVFSEVFSMKPRENAF